MALGSIDVTVLVVYLAGVVALGLAVGRGQRNLDSYLLGGRSLPWWAILGSIVATETSTATVLSVPGLAYARDGGDLRFLQLGLGYIVGRFLIVSLLLPRYFRGELVSAYQVLRERFGGAASRVASLIFLTTRNMGDGLRLYLTALALEQVLGVPIVICVLGIGCTTIVYTVAGGMRSIVWNDCVQLVVYVLGGLGALAFLLHELPGGLGQVLRYGELHDKLRIFDATWTLADPYVLWAGLIGGAVLNLGTHGTDQMLVQRLLCARDARSASKALIASGFVVTLQFALFLFLGLALACYDDALRPGLELAGDRAFANFIVYELPRNVGLVGLLLAAIMAASMSTLSSSLNASAASLIEDWRAADRAATDGPSLRRTRIYSALFGLLQILIAIGAVHLSSSVVTEALAIAGFSAGLLLGVFVLGAWAPRATQADALAGLCAGSFALCFVQFGLPHMGVHIAWPWLAAIGSTVTFGVGQCAAHLR